MRDVLREKKVLVDEKTVDSRNKTAIRSSGRRRGGSSYDVAVSTYALFGSGNLFSSLPICRPS